MTLVERLCEAIQASPHDRDRHGSLIVAIPVDLWSRIVAERTEAADALEAAEREIGELGNSLSQETAWRLEVQAERGTLAAQLAQAREASALLCDEMSLSMPDEPQEFDAKNIWGAFAKVQSTLSTPAGEGADG